MTLRIKAFSAVRWTATAAVVNTTLQIGQIVILARILSPEDFGLMAMVGVVLSFAGLFTDLGINSAYIQKQQVTLEQRSSLFWLNVSVSGGLTALVIAMSPLFAWYFGDDRISPLMMITSSTFIINSLGQQIRLTAEKQLDFQPIILMDIAAAILGFCSAVLAATSGWGVYSLIVSGIVSALTGTLLAWTFVAKGWYPTWRMNNKDLQPFLGFGLALVADSVVSHINLTIDLFLGGRILSASQLGLYSVPRNLVLQLQWIVNPIISRVGFPLIAQVQSDVDKVKMIYLKTLNMTASTNAPLYVGIAIFSPEIVHILLGPGWNESSELLRIMAAWGFLRSTVNPVGSLLLGMGRPRLSLQWNTCLLFIVPLVILLGSQYGSIGLACALLALSITLYIPCWYILVRPLCHAKFLEYSVASLRSFFLALLSIVPVYFVIVEIEGPLLRLTVAIIICAPLYLVLSYIGNRDWFTAMTELFGIKLHKLNR